MPLKSKHLILFLIGCVLLLQGAGNTSGKDRPGRVIQFSGLVLTGDSLEPVSYATVYVKGTQRGTVSDYNGFFSLPVYTSDTLRFSSVGYKEVYYTVPDTLTQNRYSAIQLMSKDTIHLPETVIYPWPTREQFRHAFIHTEVPDDDYDYAMRNLARAEMKDRMEEMPMDGSMNFRHQMNQQANRLYYAGQRPPMRIFDPLAWGEFIKAWREGRFRRQ